MCHVRYLALLLAVAALCAFRAAPLAAQREAPLAEGTRVRVVGRDAPAKTMRGEVRRISGDTLVIYDPAADGDWAIPLEWIGSLRRPRTIRVTDPEVLIGMAAGTWLFWGIGETLPPQCFPNDDTCLFTLPRELTAATMAMLGAAVGMALGGGLELLLRGSWEAVPLSALRATAVPLPGGHVGIGASVRF